MLEKMQQIFTQRWWVSVGSTKVSRYCFTQTRSKGQMQGSNWDKQAASINLVQIVRRKVWRCETRTEATSAPQLFRWSGAAAIDYGRYLQKGVKLNLQGRMGLVLANEENTGTKNNQDLRPASILSTCRDLVSHNNIIQPYFQYRRNIWVLLIV